MMKYFSKLAIDDLLNFIILLITCDCELLLFMKSETARFFSACPVFQIKNFSS